MKPPINELNKYQINSTIAVIDLFCGIGGLSHGFVSEQFKVVAGVDIDNTCKFAFENNNNAIFVPKSITDVTSDEIAQFYKGSEIKIMVGCAPCQPFSSYTFKNKQKKADKWKLLYEFSRLIRESQPDIVSMENVAQLLNFKQAPVLNDFIVELKSQGYFVSHKVVYCPDYGIPQTRKRLVLLASKFGDINLIPPTHSPNNYRTVKDTIGNLTKLEDGATDPEDALHFARKLSKLNKQRIMQTPYGGGWKDWPADLLLDCHKKKSGKSYASVYGRMKWEEPAPTVTTHCIGLGNGRFGHPEQHRGISLREAALFQTFPLQYKFFPSKEHFSTSTIARQLGNAVPVLLGQIIAKSIKEHLKNFKK